MKKYIALFIVIAMLCALASCGAKTPAEDTTAPEAPVSEEIPDDTELAGGYTVNAEIPEAKLPEEVKAAFDGALKDYAGMSFTPVAYLGSQVVAGSNYAILCLGKAVVPDAKAALKVVVVYKDLEGKSSVLRVNDFNLLDYVSTDDADAAEGKKAEAPVGGGWTLNTEFEDAVLDERAQEACDKALEGIMGTHYQPIACLGTQVVAGTNYAMLCNTEIPAAEENPSELRIVTIYSGVDGTIEVLNTATLDLAAIAG